MSTHLLIVFGIALTLSYILERLGIGLLVRAGVVGLVMIVLAVVVTIYQRAKRARRPS